MTSFYFSEFNKDKKNEGTRLVKLNYKGKTLSKLNHLNRLFEVIISFLFRQVDGCCFSSDCSQVLSCSDDDTVRLWDSATGKCLRILQGHTDWVSNIYHGYYSII